MTKSPLVLDYPELHPVAGFSLAVAETGMKYQNRPDLMLLVADTPVAVAGVLTRSKTAAPAVDWCRHILKRGKARAVLVNAGNANAFTGHEGVKIVEDLSNALADTIGSEPTDVLIASTGVIGETPDIRLITQHLADMDKDRKADNWQQAAQAICTTDTFPKATSRKIEIGGQTITITAIAKGSGMIAPDMATMLCFIATDAAITPECLEQITAPCADRSFNAITVDSDTSTSDTLLVLASGRADNPQINNPESADGMAFKDALVEVMIELAQLVVRDGEGASKFITISVTGAADDMAARRIGFAVANSPLVKTAIAGADPNWGRIVMAVGKSGETLMPDKLSITIGGFPVAKDGRRIDGYVEEPVAEYMQGQEIDIAIDVGVAAGDAVVWTCDLTREYIAINADYRS